MADTTKPKPEACDDCRRPIMQVFYDAKTPRGWGNFCPGCFVDNGCKLGTGLGQRYQLNFEDKKYHKTAG
jgi:hypothetical protein